MEPKDNLMCLEIRRDHILADSLREARKKKFDPRKRIKVKFAECM